MAPEALNEKVRREQDFHNQWARSVDLDGLLVRESFEAPTAIENRYALEQLGELRGKKVLDLGCGAGECSVYFALKGADVHSLDIAEEFLKVAEALAAKHGVKITTRHAEAGGLPYPDASFDIVFGNGVLHHVELEPTAKEIRRVLRPGGKAVFVEPLPYNPAINVYRKMAAGVRTEDEKPLSFGQIESLRPYFSRMHHEEFWFASLLIFFHFFLVRRWHPSKVRYWKKVIEEGESYRGMFEGLQRADKFLLGRLPFLKRMCWNTVIVATK
jgi:2-polyprenyl-3-methyl-5-hydroxy-6-metoxy-1,4-benzoquinol methylase